VIESLPVPGLVASAAWRTSGELLSWLERETPARAVELTACRDLDGLPPRSVRSAPQAASWN
jgi:hypothetical protein